jgi:hypothetical protein
MGKLKPTEVRFMARGHKARVYRDLRGQIQTEVPTTRSLFSFYAPYSYQLVPLLLGSREQEATGTKLTSALSGILFLSLLTLFFFCQGAL